MALTAYSTAEVDAARRPTVTREPPRIQSKLAQWASDAFRAAVVHRDQDITGRMHRCRRQASGEYESDVLAKITALGGSKAFFNITATKASAGESWLRDTMMPTNDKAWELVVPTPLPSLPMGLQQRAAEAVVARFSLEATPPTQEEVMAFTTSMAEELERMYQDEAKDRVRKAEEKMSDQLAEGRFNEALIEFIQHLVIYPLAWLKGPVIRSQRRIVWGERGEFTIQQQFIPVWGSPHPLDMYPCPNARTPQDGYICERVRYTKTQLAQMRGQDGWNTAALEAVLRPPRAPQDETTEMTEWTAIQGESERAVAEDRDLAVSGGLTEGQVEGVEIWGCVQGQTLLDWGGRAPWLAKARQDPVAYQDVCVILIGNRVVKAILNPDPLGHTPYSVSSFYPRAGSLVGEALPERMRDCQDTINATARAIQNNTALSSGPFQMVDLDSLEGGQHPEQLRPWRIFQYRGSKSGGKVPITFHDVPVHTRELLEIMEYWGQQADDRTLIPRYTHGNEDVGGAGETASGLNMLMTAAARGISLVIARMDKDIIKPTLTRLYNHNMQYGDPKLRGDAQIVPRGLLATLVKQENHIRQLEFLNVANNPIDQQFIGPKQRATVWRELAQSTGLPVEKVVPTEDEMDEIVAQQQEQQALMAQGQQQGKRPVGAGKEQA